MTNDEIGRSLVDRYGHLMKADEVAAALRYESVAAFRMARKRGQILLTPKSIGGRRSQMYATAEVAAVLEKWLYADEPVEEHPMRS